MLSLGVGTACANLQVLVDPNAGRTLLLTLCKVAVEDVQCEWWDRATKRKVIVVILAHRQDQR